MAKRNANVEILRVVAMLFIIMHHCIINGYGLQNLLNNSTGGGYTIFLGSLNAVVVIGVNVFFLISGYYGIRFSFKKFLHLIFDLYLYADLLILLSVVTGMEKFGFATIKLLLLPFYKYWFVIVYLLLYLISPLLNAGIDALKREYAILLAGFFTGFFCILGFVSEATFVSLNNGYSLMYAAYLYYIGRMMNKYRLFRKPQDKQAFAWAASTVITAGGCAACVLVQRYEWAWKVFSYNQLFLTLASINFVWMFINIPERNGGDKWQKIASHTLAVYYIHTCTVFSYYRNLPLKWVATNINPILQILILAVYAVLIYLVCALIDCIKVRVFRKSEVNLIDKIYDAVGQRLSITAKI